MIFLTAEDIAEFMLKLCLTAARKAAKLRL